MPPDTLDDYTGLIVPENADPAADAQDAAAALTVWGASFLSETAGGNSAKLWYSEVGTAPTDGAMQWNLTDAALMRQMDAAYEQHDHMDRIILESGG